MISKSFFSFIFIVCITILLQPLLVFAQTPGLNKSVLLSSQVSNDPLQITLNWQPVPGATSYRIFRKSINENSWANTVSGNLGSGTLSWTDKNIKSGTGYEYCVIGSGTNNSAGYIYSGIEIPEVFFRGKILLVFDSISTKGLDFEINRWISDVEGDGYKVIPIPVNRSEAVASVKSKILNSYDLDKQNTVAVFLLGRVPVPYSGVIAPDGHPDHQGAWPADGYYAELHGTWSDNLANNTSGSSNRNHNIKGDGKFDQNSFPSDVDLQIGRVDMYNLPSFTSNEKELIRKYLNKNHAFRHKKIIAEEKALIDDEFTGYPEGFSASGWRNFSSLFGFDKIQSSDYLPSLKEKSFLWSYGCGAGNFKNCAGVIGSSDFNNDSLKGVFTMLFGSYFGDWDSPEDNLLRSALASGSTLTNCWAGRPFWYFHHMGLGESIGYATLVSMNNSGIYDFNNSQRGIHMALMGDPTLRSQYVFPPNNFTVNNIDGVAIMKWEASGEPVIGYNIYKRNDSLNVFEKINNLIIKDTFFIDSCLIYPGVYEYMVRAIKLEKTNSGSYYNMSTGITDTLFNPYFKPVIAGFDFGLEGYKINFKNQSKNAYNFVWDFGDGTTSVEKDPLHEYRYKGDYEVRLKAVSECGTDISMKKVVILIGGMEYENNDKILLYPNPAGDILKFILDEKQNCENKKFAIFNVNGRQIYENKFDSDCEADISVLEPGFYIFKIKENPGLNIKFIKM